MIFNFSHSFDHFNNIYFAFILFLALFEESVMSTIVIAANQFSDSFTTLTLYCPCHAQQIKCCKIPKFFISVRHIVFISRVLYVWRIRINCLNSVKCTNHHSLKISKIKEGNSDGANKVGSLSKTTNITGPV